MTDVTTQNPARDPAKTYAPWSGEEVQALNRFQDSGIWHPFTSNRGAQLIATTEGWVEAAGGPVVQTWAHVFMANARLIDAELAKRERMGLSLPKAPVEKGELMVLTENEIDKAKTSHADGWVEWKCWLNKPSGQIYHRALAANLPGAGCSAHMDFVDDEGRFPDRPEAATQIIVEISYLPKYDPTHGTHKGFVSFYIDSNKLQEAKELALLFGYTVNQGVGAGKGYEVIIEEARRRAIELVSPQLDPDFTILRQRLGKEITPPEN